MTRLNRDTQDNNYSFTFSATTSATTSKKSPAPANHPPEFPLDASASSSNPFPDVASAPPSYEDAVHNTEEPSYVVVPDFGLTPLPSAPTFLDAHDRDLYDDINADDVPLLSGESDEAAEQSSSVVEVSPPGYSIYQAELETDSRGVVSWDKHLNEDPEALYQFLVTHNSRPGMQIDFHGHHDETRTRIRSYTDKDGRSRTETEYYTETVTDFQFSVDASDYVAHESHTGLYVLPQPESRFASVLGWFKSERKRKMEIAKREQAKPKTARELCGEYVRSKNLLKEIKVSKQVEWDFEELTSALTAAIRHAGFHRCLTISYPTSNDATRVRSDSRFARFWDKTWVQILLFVTCLWIILWPAMWMYKQRIGKDVLRTNFGMMISERDWYARHIQEIVNKVHW